MRFLLALALALFSAPAFAATPGIVHVKLVTTAGPIVLANVKATDAIIPTVLSIIIGAVFGYVSEVVANALTKKGEPSAEATADPGHAG